MSIPPTMRAAQLDEAGGPLTVRTLPTPRPGAGEVLVRVAAAPINPSDLDVLQQPRFAGRALPIVPGIEGSGTVVAAGAGLLPLLWHGRRVACAAAAGGNGTWAEYLVTPATQCVPLASRLSFEQGAMLLVNPLTALAFFTIARRDGHRALVNTAAAGALGRMVLRLSREQGIPAIHVVRREEQVALLQSLGAEHVLASSEPDFGPRLRALAHDLHATLLLDAVAGVMTGQLLDAAPYGSTVLLYGHLGSDEIRAAVHTLNHGAKQVRGFYLPNWLAGRSFLATLADTRRVQQLAPGALQTHIQARFSLENANEALAHYREKMTAGKVMLLP